MTYKFQYQYKDPKRHRPEDYGQMDDLDAQPGEQIIVPNVGDTVILRLSDDKQRKMYKVLTRNFSYLIHEPMNIRLCSINIVVTDVDDDEQRARLKE